MRIQRTGIDTKTAWRWLCERFKATRALSQPARRKLEISSVSSSKATAEAPPLPKEPRFQIYTNDHAKDAEHIKKMRTTAAANRGLPVGAFMAAEELNLVRYGQVRGSDCWILSDREGRIHEARRIDNGLHKKINAKADTDCHPGGKKWPVNSDRLEVLPSAAVLLCEGGPDLIAAIEIVSTLDIIPVAILGSSSIHTAALPRFAGRKVIISADPGKKGRDTAYKWAASLLGVGAKVTGFTDAEYDLNDLLREKGVGFMRNHISGIMEGRRE